MSLSEDSSVAIVLLPALSDARHKLAPGSRRWLARASVKRQSDAASKLLRLQNELELQPTVTGVAALRMWGQTGDQPTIWAAALDPVYLEPRLDHLRLHALGPEQLSPADLRGIIDHLQNTLAMDDGIGFARIGRYGYLRSDGAMTTAEMPPEAVHGENPNDYLPAGEGAGRYRNLLSEIEMSLHEHVVNARREAAGLLPINSLWLWGGGRAPDVDAVPLPPLFSNDALLRGYWLSRAGSVANWPETMQHCLKSTDASIVAVPEPRYGDPHWLSHCLAELLEALQNGRFERLLLLLADGHRVRLVSSDRWRFWRNHRALFE